MYILVHSVALYHCVLQSLLFEGELNPYDYKSPLAPLHVFPLLSVTPELCHLYDY